MRVPVISVINNIVKIKGDKEKQKKKFKRKKMNVMGR